MPVSEAHKRASNKWNKSRDQLMFRPTKEVGAQIREAAAKAGLSVQQYVLQAVEAYMKEEKNHFSIH